jgi:hypothetical protein
MWFIAIEKKVAAIAFLEMAAVHGSRADLGRKYGLCINHILRENP